MGLEESLDSVHFSVALAISDISDMFFGDRIGFGSLSLCLQGGYYLYFGVSMYLYCMYTYSGNFII